MDIKDFFKMMSNFNSDSLNIGEMLDKLNQFNDDEKIVLSNGTFLDGDYGSYRGYYKDLYIGWDDEDKGFNTVGKLKEILNNALNEGIMQGYKGGEFPITEDTLVWHSSYGCCGEMIVDIQKINEEIFVIIIND